MSKQLNQTPEVDEAEDIETPEEEAEGTEAEEPVETPDEGYADPEPDYKTKFSESSKEALKLLEEKKELEAKLASFEEKPTEDPSKSDEEPLYPGFEMLSEDEQKNILEYTNGIKRSTLDAIYKDPAISDAKKRYSESKWDSAFADTVEKYPELKDSKEEFKSKYFKADNVPDNINEILSDISKIYLFDKARDIGAAEAKASNDLIDIERANAGDKTPKTGRTMEDWQKLSEDNPGKFAKLSKEFNEDMKNS